MSHSRECGQGCNNLPGAIHRIFMRVDVCRDHITKNKNSVRKKIVRERYVFVGPLRSALPPPLGSFCSMPTPRVGHVDNVDNQLKVAWPRSPKPCALPGVDNVDNCFLLVHMIHILLCASLFFLRGNSLRVDLWVKWTMWTPVLNWWRMRCQPCVTPCYKYIST